MQTEIRTEMMPLLPEQFTVYLARHAMPDRTRFDIPYAVLPGPELTLRGHEEAAELGEFFRSNGVSFIQASPFERALRTAVSAAQAAGVSVEINDDLAEWRADEVESGVVERMQRAFLDAARHSARRAAPAAVLTHGGPVLALLKILGAPHTALERCRIYDHRNPLPTAGAWLVERDGDGLRIELAFLPAPYSFPAADTCRFVIPIEQETAA